MAHQIVPLYNLQSSVGKNGKNLFEDVKLVQALLKIIAENNGPSFWTQAAKLYNKPRPTEAFPSVNGQNDKALELWINLILAVYSKSGFSLSEDGRIDPMPEPAALVADTHVGSRSRNMYLLCAQAAACNLHQYLEIGNTRDLMYAIIPGGHVNR